MSFSSKLIIILTHSEIIDSIIGVFYNDINMIVATARIKGDSMPDSKLYLKNIESFTQLKEHINQEVTIFLTGLGYTYIISNFSKIDIYEEENNNKKRKKVLIKEIENDPNIISDDEIDHIPISIFRDQINLLIDYMQDDSESKRRLVYYEKDNTKYVEIIATATHQEFHIHFNQAPNRNGWDQLDVAISYLPQ
jgi:hypothetical protein